jgi:hypothetical protein
MGRRLRFALLSISAVLLVVICQAMRPAMSQSPASHPLIMTFGTNTAEGNQALNLSGLRMGCAKTPEECVQLAAKHAQSQGVSMVYIAFELSSTTAPTYARRFSVLSSSNPFLHAIGVDDFVSTLYHLQKDSVTADPADLVKDAIEGAKSTNPNLNFGVTVYEDDLDSPFIQEHKLPYAIRSQIDYVHLYIHFRQNGPRYETYVEKAKHLFPRAKIIAGSYPYDRIDYLPCVQGGTRRCSQSEEIDSYKKSIEIQAGLLKNNRVAGIEFYPAEFGREDQWNGWNNPKACNPDRRRECIENTRLMRQAAIDVLKAEQPIR